MARAFDLRELPLAMLKPQLLRKTRWLEFAMDKTVELKEKCVLRLGLLARDLDFWLAKHDV